MRRPQLSNSTTRRVLLKRVTTMATRMTNVYKTTEEVELRTQRWWIWNRGYLRRRWQRKLCKVESRWSPTTQAPGEVVT